MGSLDKVHAAQRARIDAIHQRADALARKLSDGQVALIRKGGRGLIGIGFAGELLASAWLDVAGLDALSERAMAIADAIRADTSLHLVPDSVTKSDKVIAEARGGSPQPAQMPTSTMPDYAIVARVKNQALLDRLKARHQEQMAA